MKAADATRAAVLVEALGEIDAIREQLLREKPGRGYAVRGVEVNVGSFSDGSAETDAALLLDLTTGAKLVDFLEKLIREELAALGVTP